MKTAAKYRHEVAKCRQVAANGASVGGHRSAVAGTKGRVGGDGRMCGGYHRCIDGHRAQVAASHAFLGGLRGTSASVRAYGTAPTKLALRKRTTLARLAALEHLLLAPNGAPTGLVDLYR